MGISTPPEPNAQPQLYDLTPKVVSIIVATGREDWTGSKHLADIDLRFGPLVVARAKLMQTETARFLSFHIGAGAPRVEFIDPDLALLAREAAEQAFDQLTGPAMPA